MPRISEPYQVTIGRVVGVFQGTNHYDVISDAGRFEGTYHGASRGPGGVMESGTIVGGSRVWIAFCPGERICSIIGVFLPPWQADVETDPQQLATDPQVSGFKPGERATGQIYEQSIHGVYNRPNDSLDDFVNGEWGMTSPHGGGGVGVELFRSWIRGGPFSGLWCWHDSQLTRLAGLDFEFLTLAQHDYDRRHGNAIVKYGSRVLYPDEAIDDHLPRELEIDGAIHGGQHRFVAADSSRERARAALFHEFIGTDGSYALTSAAGIYLQRYAGIVVPEESRAPEPDEPALLGEQPLDDAGERQVVLDQPRKSMAGDVSGITWAQRAIDVIHSVTSFKGRGGFDRLPVQWPDYGKPSEVPEDLTHTVYTPDMWRRMPRAAGFNITIDSHEHEKKFYVGRSLVGLMPDGSVLIEDAYHSQILMSGGSVMISAANDIVLAAGRNIIGIAGRDAGLRANRHIDVAANEGRVSIKAEDQLALLGANGGQGGVLIESRSTADTSKSGTGTDQQIGGILLKSKAGLYGEGVRVGLTATEENVAIMAEKGELHVQAVAGTSKFDQEYTLVINDAGYSFLESTASFPGVIGAAGQIYATGLFCDGPAIVDGSVAATGSVGGVGGVGQIKGFSTNTESRFATQLQDQAKRLVTAAEGRLTKLLALRTPLNNALAKLLGFSFATTEQLNLQQDRAFELPETRWQTISRRGDHGLSDTWIEKVIVSPAGDGRQTAPLPGYEAWAVKTTYRLHNTDQFVDLKTGKINPSPSENTEGSPTLTDEQNVPLNNNYRIGKKPT